MINFPTIGQAICAMLLTFILSFVSDSFLEQGFSGFEFFMTYVVCALMLANEKKFS